MREGSSQMRSTIQKLLIGFWIIGATLVLVYFWGNNPDMFPRPPEEFSIWLTSVFSVANGEELSDIELLYMLFLSFIFVSIVPFLMWFIWSHTQKKLEPSP